MADTSFAPGQQEEVRAVCEGYRAKTNPHIVMVSTPYKPGDLFEQIDRDPNSIFKKLSYHYFVGLGKIYNEQEIEKERSQPSGVKPIFLAKDVMRVLQLFMVKLNQNGAALSSVLFSAHILRPAVKP